jgi:hypothetical protein
MLQTIENDGLCVRLLPYIWAVSRIPSKDTYEKKGVSLPYIWAVSAAVELHF